ncbi:hypothetical protein OIDMADRAFT_198320 [Oidiodendron maius Zn]|uniref:Mitochondrial transcription factor 1 n=1 Tax=Oidiodendron maius (strain Zn) TaxID=913774 RepID=A0A0C3GYS4_OIDMZ|nr:hypothetical protein OIDMADRAFT_198320 [Oidiodendron maius Zn]
MFRALSITSGSALLRCPSTLNFLQLSCREASTTPPGLVKRGRKELQSEDLYINDSIYSSSLLETPKPKRKTTRQNVQTQPNSDDSAPEEADKYGEQKAAAVGTIKGKKAKKSMDVADLVQLASRAHDEEGILRYLKFVYPGGWREKRSIAADLKRVHVLNKSLCDDTLERLRPSLERHIGCDIIDLNPGPGIWSSTIHDFLKPRTHILMEPDATVYKPLLQPLLDAEGSTYKLVPNSGVVWNSLQEILSPQLLPHQEAFERGDSRLEEPNNTLLVVANLGYYPKKPYRGFASVTNLVIYQLLSAARSHSLFHKYGLIRMLLWVDDEAKRTVLPRTVLGRRKAAIEAELTCSDINEIVTSTSSAGPVLRDHTLDLQSSLASLQRMKEAGLATPTHRRGALEVEAAAHVSGDLDSKYWLKKDFYKALDDLERRFAAGEFTMFTDTPEGRAATKVIRLSEKSKACFTPEYRELERLRVRCRVESYMKRKLDTISWEHDAIISMRKQAANLEGLAAEQLKQEAENRYSTMMKEIASSGFNEKVSSMVTYMLENHSAFHQNPPLLYWDRRRAEPLQARPDEFFPNCEMGLLDFQPQSIWPILRENFPANYDVFEYILSTLLMLPSQTIRQGLDALAPGASEWIIPKCPSIIDPEKGGSLHLDAMTVRCLSLDMYKEILEAWLKWPFRPSRYELLSKMGSDIYDPNDLDI